MTSLPGRLGLSPPLAEGRPSEALRYLSVRNLVQFWLFVLRYRPHYGAHAQGRRR